MRTGDSHPSSASSSNDAQPGRATPERLSQLRLRIERDCLARDFNALTKLLARVGHRVERGQPHDRDLERLHAAMQRSADQVRLRRDSLPQPALNADLPIISARPEIEAAIEANPCIIVCGDTGSGKTTQLPQICLGLGRGARGLIGHTQPRRLAARSVSQRIGEEIGLSAAVGYKIRFTDTVGEHARIKLMTDGIALAEIGHDRELRQYDTLIIDEAHERSLNIDFLLGYLKQLLPRRPDLKLIITSATIDPDSLSAHFDNAPIVSVEGRSYPVEIRYQAPAQEPGENAEQGQEIAAAIDGLWREGGGDTLVFLPTERDIRDCAAFLSRRYADTEVLQLFGRQSGSEQQRIFQPGGKRRIVLATNVAETSLTVPGITYVIDTGTARISRYSVHAKVQRLPIEKISQASAIQRAGRCGRVAPGVCVRLYDEHDFIQRDEFTEPEILRTNLASVILQMAAADLGDFDDFPFVQTPAPRYVNDGYRLLQELGALGDDRGITAHGRRLARIPVDPRLAQVLLNADQHGCLPAALIIVAALAIQDPRERPLDKAQAADEQQARFADPRSDFLSYLKLWQAFAEQRETVSGNQQRRWCEAHFLSHRRMREWLDLHGQLRESCKDLGLAPGESSDVDYAALHKALLSGFVTLVSHYDGESYVAVRDRRVHIFPGSGQFRRKPKWILAAEYAETSRVFARCVARIEPAWIEALAPHLLKRTWRDPRWDRKRGAAVADEQTSLYGLVITPRRVVNLARHDRSAARDIFIRHALVRGEVRDLPAFVQRNLELASALFTREEKLRSRGLLVDEDTRGDFYAARIPDGVFDMAGLRRWLRKQSPEEIDALHWNEKDLIEAGAADDGIEQFPDELIVGANALPLAYRFEPGHRADGITVTVPVALLHDLAPATGEWLVPGLHLDKVIALIKGLPKQLRKHFVPAPDFASACVDSLSTSHSLLAGISRQLEAMTGNECPIDALRAVELPPHLQMRFRVVGDEGETLGEGRDLRDLQRTIEHDDNPRTSEIEQSGLRDWTFGDLPEFLEDEQRGLKVRRYPALVAESDGVSLRLFTSAVRANEAMPRGLLALYRRRLNRELRYLRRNIPHLDELCIWFVRTGSCEQLREDLLDAVLIEALEINGAAPRTRAEFLERLNAAAPELATLVNQLAEHAAQVLERHHAIQNQLSGEHRLSLNEAAADILDQLDWLIYPGFLSNTPWWQVAELPRYLDAVQHRLQSIDRSPERDRQRRGVIEPLWARCKNLLKHPGYGADAETVALRWQLEELRVSMFAQQLGTREKVSVARVEKRLEQARRRLPN